MSQFLNFGSGSNGVLTVSSPTTHAPIDSSCSGSIGSTSLSATNVSFATGQFIMVHQSRGTGAGQWEINKIASYVAGTITLVHPLSYTYADSGASQSQVIVMPQYSDIAVSSTLTAKAWNGNVGGIIPLLCSIKLPAVKQFTVPYLRTDLLTVIGRRLQPSSILKRICGFRT